jgi:hypothetical protein
MAKPSSRDELKEYCLRRLGKPVLEINVDDDQVEDLIDDAIQFYHERHGEGIDRVFLKHKLLPSEKTTIVGIASTTIGTSSFGGVTSMEYEEGANYLALPDTIIGVNKIFKVDSSSVSDGLFNIKYQLFLNDLYYYGAIDLLNYGMVKSYLETLDFLINPDAQIRFNKKNSRLYLDIDLNSLSAVYNDSWLKRYATSLIKRQWGQNLIKFQGVKLPGGLEMNGRQLYDDAIREIEELEQKLMSEFAMPPLDMIG